MKKHHVVAASAHHFYYYIMLYLNTCIYHIFKLKQRITVEQIRGSNLMYSEQLRGAEMADHLGKVWDRILTYFGQLRRLKSKII